MPKIVTPKDLPPDLIAKALEDHQFPLGSLEINAFLADIYWRLDKLTPRDQPPVPQEDRNTNG